MKQLTPYAVPRSAAPIDLRLDSNEGPLPGPELWSALDDPELLRRYPAASELESELARRFDLPEAGVLVTAGADDALLRASLAFLEPGRELVVATPAFEMIPAYARQVGATIRSVPEDPARGRLPLEGLLSALEAAGDRLGLLAVVSPSNPTGSVATAAELRSLATVVASVPSATLLLDAAYAEYAGEDLTPAALQLPNTISVRTFSKAWGLAGARVGYVLGEERRVRALRAVGNPYAVAGPSLALAGAALTRGARAMNDHVERVRTERELLSATLLGLGARPWPSEANFVLAEVPDPRGLRDALAERGIGIRIFPGKPSLEKAVRITCPGAVTAFERLERELIRALGEGTSTLGVAT